MKNKNIDATNAAPSPQPKRKDKRAKKNGKNKVRFSGFLCRLMQFACGIACKFLGARSHRSEAFEKQKKEGPMLLLANHLSSTDFIFFTQPTKGAKLNYVVAQNMMYSTPIFAFLIKHYGAITKKQFFADLTCIKNIKRNLDSGISVLICPEGKVAADGKTGLISNSIARLIKWLGYPVGLIKLSGPGLARPKWAAKHRKVKVDIDCDMLFAKEDVEALSKEEIYARTVEAMAHNEHEWQQQNHILIKECHRAEGLEKLLYRCPRCGSEFEMKSQGDTLMCARCGNAVIYGEDGSLAPANQNSVCPERIDLWFDAERKLAAEEAAGDFHMTDDVYLFRENDKGNGYKFVTEGTLKLSQDGLDFAATSEVRPKKVKTSYGINHMDITFNGGDTEAVEEEFLKLHFPIDHAVTVANMPGYSLDIYDDKHVYRFMFKDRLVSGKYVLLIESYAAAQD